jgi:hypothetical protein
MTQTDNQRAFDPRLPFATTLASVSSRRRADAQPLRPFLRVVCEVDGSAAAGRAVWAATLFCRQQNATLELVAAAQPALAIHGPLPIDAITAALTTAATVAREQGVAVQSSNGRGTRRCPGSTPSTDQQQSASATRTPTG